MKRCEVVQMEFNWVSIALGIADGGVRRGEAERWMKKAGLDGRKLLPCWRRECLSGDNFLNRIT
jgi:hypothetical protein